MKLRVTRTFVPERDELLAKISELRAENEVRRAELADLLPLMDADGMRISNLRAENERLRADLRASLADKHSVSNANERLRAALRGVLAEADRQTDAFDRAHAALDDR
jgi:septal ring factor EnvC (AmiA/AmiB activator)